MRRSCARRLKKIVPLGTQIYYSLWQWKVLAVCRKLKKNVRFDIAHHLTFGVTWQVPTISFLRIPLVWGPIGGGDIVPQEIMKRESIRSRAQELCYKILARWVCRLSPLAWFARKKVAAILFRTSSAEKIFPVTQASKRYILCETATYADIKPRKNQNDGKIKAVCVGRLQYWKGFRYAIEGFHRFLQSGGDGMLTFLGNGPEFRIIRQYCQKNNCSEKVLMLGKVPFYEVQKILEESNVLIHPSFRDGGSWAVLEGMMKGLPIICMNCSGSADMVDETSGIRIDADNPEDAINGISKALTKLSREPELRKILGIGAQKRVEKYYRWSKRREQIQQIYNKVISGI